MSAAFFAALASQAEAGPRSPACLALTNMIEIQVATLSRASADYFAAQEGFEAAAAIDDRVMAVLAIKRLVYAAGEIAGAFEAQATLYEAAPQCVSAHVVRESRRLADKQKATMRELAATLAETKRVLEQ